MRPIQPEMSAEQMRVKAPYAPQTVVALCERDGLPTPDWVSDPAFRLAEPRYLYDGTGRIRDWLRETTPPQFASRNIWSGNRLLRRV